MLGSSGASLFEPPTAGSDRDPPPDIFEGPHPAGRGAEAGGAHESGGTPELFAGLGVRNQGWRRRGLALPLSLALHTVGVGLLVLLPILSSAPPPAQPDYIRALLYDPPPPPPPPLPKGSGLTPKRAAATAPAPKPSPEQTPVTPPQELPRRLEPPPVEHVKPESAAASPDGGSPAGSVSGTPEGMERGVEGGIVGGVPGGVIGGVIGGTGDIPVRDYDRPPRILKQTRPRYPQEAFVKKIEGTVLLEILIDASGRVVHARVVESVPALDAAAVEAVREWVFSPAIKGGRTVATVALAPVTFRIY